MPGKLNTNYLGKVISALGGKNSTAYTLGRNYIDKMIGNKMLMAGAIGAGTALAGSIATGSQHKFRNTIMGAGLGAGMYHAGPFAYNMALYGGMGSGMRNAAEIGGSAFNLARYRMRR